MEASGDMLWACARSEVGRGGGWLWVGLCLPEKDVQVLNPGACDWDKIMPF